MTNLSLRIAFACLAASLAVGCASHREASLNLTALVAHSGGVSEAEVARCKRDALARFRADAGKRDGSRPIRYWIHAPKPSELIVSIPIGGPSAAFHAVELFRYDLATGKFKGRSTVFFRPVRAI